MPAHAVPKNEKNQSDVLYGRLCQLVAFLGLLRYLWLLWCMTYSAVAAFFAVTMPTVHWV